MILHVLRIPILAQTLLLVSASLATVRSATADDRWQFTRTELGQCKRIELDPDRDPFSMILPKNAVCRHSTIMVGSTRYLLLERRDLMKPLAQMRLLAIQSGYRIVASHDNVLVVDRGSNQGHYLYCYHPDRAVLAGQIKSREDCLFRVKCAMSLRPLKTPGIDARHHRLVRKQLRV